MYGRWYIDHTHFTNKSPFAFVRQIDVAYHDRKKTVEIQLLLSSIHTKWVFDLFIYYLKNIKKNDYEKITLEQGIKIILNIDGSDMEGFYSAKIELTSYVDLIVFLMYINEKSNEQEFPPILVANLILYYIGIINLKDRTISGIEDIRKEFYLSLPTYQDADYKVNQNYNHTNNLLTYLKSFKKRTGVIDIGYIISLLKNGANPNVYSNGEESPLQHAICFQNDTLVKALLYWGANPFKCSANNIYDVNAVEYAYEKRNLTALKIFCSIYYTNPERKIKDIFNFSYHKKTERLPNHLKKTNFSDTNYENGSIITKIIFANGKEVTTRLITIEKFNNDTELKENVCKLFFKIFINKKGHEKLKSHFNKEFSNEEESSSESNKLIEIIEDDKQVIGFNLFRISPLAKKNIIICENVYSGIDPESFMRKSGINSFLIFRVSLALRIFTDPNIAIVIYFIAIHYSSYRLMEGMDHTPRLLSNDTLLYINKLRVRNEFEDKISLDKDGCIDVSKLTEDGDLPEVIEHNQTVKSFDRDCYETFISNKNKRAPVVACLANIGFFEKLSERFKNQINVVTETKKFASILGENQHKFLQRATKTLTSKL